MKNEPSQDPAPGVKGGGAPASPNLGGPRVGDALPVEEGWGSKDLIALGAPSPATRQGAHGKWVVFADFGRGRVYALTDDGEDVSTFDSLVDLVERLSTTIIVVDSLPNKLQKTAAELAKTGITFLRLKDLKKVSEERENNGVGKSDENDVRLLRTLYRRQPELFQPLFTSPEELEVRALTELWVELVGQRKAAKRARTTTENHVAVEAHKTLRRLVDKLSEEINEKSMKLPLYRKAFEEMGLKGPALAYIISHDSLALATLPRDRLAVRYCMTRLSWKNKTLRSRLLILLTSAAVLHKHPKYGKLYEHYRQKGKRHWPAILRVAKRILRDIHGLARKTGPPA